MKIAIISDIHDNIPNLDKVLGYLKENHIDKIICCGDFGSQGTMKYLDNNFKGTIRAILGNADLDHMEYIDVKDKFKSIKLDESVSSFVIEGKEVLIVHSPDNYEPHLSRDNLKYIFYGHTHKPWQEVKNGKLIINPGNVSNYGYSPTFAVWETDNDKFDLVQLNTIK